jgi:hypothetical protein
MTTFSSIKTQELARNLFDLYESYKLSNIVSNRFTQAELLQWLHAFEERELFRKSVLGTSGEGRNITLYSIGNGPTSVLLWSQMHGDEPTATMALMDIFNFFAKNEEHFVTKTIREKLTVLVIPMLNPDGAERFLRTTAQMIDINRDALALETPEAKILKRTCDTLKPKYGFNLHDQDSRYTVGTTKKITAVALLAPAADESRGDSPVRLQAKRVASHLAQVLKLFVPENIAKWDDTFYPTAFGDNIQKWGISTVLLESGGWRGDPKKFFIRQLNCVGLLTALYAIATGEINGADASLYDQIPFNMKLGCDVIIRNATLKASGQTSPVKVDIGINFDKRFNTSLDRLDTYATIVDIGDLSTFTALEAEIDVNSVEVRSDRMVIQSPFLTDDVKYFLAGT